MSRLRPTFPFFRLVPMPQQGTLGPAASTDNAIARWDGAGGTTLQDSVVTIADTTGNMAGVGTLSSGAITSTGASSMGSLTLTTDLALADGGTAASLTANVGGIVYSTATALAILAGTATAGQILRSGASAAPTWSTATYPATAGTAGSILRSDATNFVGSTATYPNTVAISTILYASAADVISALATANSGVLVTSGTGVPSIATDIPTAVTIGTAFIYRVGGTDVSLADGGTNASLTASNGGIFYSTATAGAILAGTATAGQILRSGLSAAPSWSTATYPATAGATAGMFLRSDATNFVNSTLVLPNAAAISTILFASAADTIAALATANNGVLITSGTGVPSISSTLPNAVQDLITRLGTITLGVWNGTDIAVADGGTGVSTLGDAGVLIGNGTGVVQVTGAGTSGQVLTSNGAGVDPTFQAAAAGTPTIKVSTFFEDAARFASALTGSGSVLLGTSNFRLRTGTTSTSASDQRMNFGGSNYNIFNSSSLFTAFWEITAEDTDYQTYIGTGALTVTGTAITFTGTHYGFKSIRVASVTTLSASNAEGTTETATSFTIEQPNSIAQQFHAQKTGTTNVKFYNNRVLKATHTTNLPSAAGSTMGQFAINNAATTADSYMGLISYSFEQNAQ